jgi:hypothetical protein
VLLPLPHRADGFVVEVDGLAVADRTSAEGVCAAAVERATYGFGAHLHRLYPHILYLNVYLISPP